MEERIQKVLAHAGFGSRRQVEALIRDERITINGKPARLGDRVGPEDSIRVDGDRVRIGARPVKRKVLLYHKPEGEICTRSDPGERATIFDHLPAVAGGRWVAVGRLDLNTSGLILLTSDGELANRLMHPSTGVQREYAARVLGRVTPAMLQRLKKGVRLAGGLAAFERIVEMGGRGANRWFRVTLREGRNRAVRRIWESQGVKVSRLIRLRYGPISLPKNLAKGRWRLLQAKDLEKLVAAAEPGAEDRKQARAGRARGRGGSGRRRTDA